ncbi:hypothetical protein BJ742DRAFT_816841 [Cladochytrium replicatum]|nr:hypothetical protein BJ742DRAFT_816841 [Cladochytrium replicatum]
MASDLRRRQPQSVLRSSDSQHDSLAADRRDSRSSVRLSSHLLAISFVLLVATAFWRVESIIPRPNLDTSLSSPKFSEGIARQHLESLEGFGQRLVGSGNLVESENWLLAKLEEYKALRNTKYVPSFEIDVQFAEGSHLFQIANVPTWKYYKNLTNIVAKLSCGPTCDANTILVNSHLDTTIATAGATDDGAGVVVMLELVRLLAMRDAPLKNAVVFLWNGAEESLQDGSHAFIVHHKWAPTVRIVLNLEACGNDGPGLVFQANSATAVEAYARVPYPHGGTISNDIFSTGLIISDTDFRQFVDYGNLTGLDLAFVKNSYVYHTMADSLENLRFGRLQALGENSAAIVEYLVSTADLTNVKQGNDLLFYDFLGYICVYMPWAWADIIHLSVAAISLVLVLLPTPGSNSKAGVFFRLGHVLFGTLIIVVVGFIGTLLGGISAALWLVHVVQKPQTWFIREWYSIALFVFPATAGLALVSYVFRTLFMERSIRSSASAKGDPEHFAFKCVLLGLSIFTALGTVARSGLSYIMLFPTLSVLFGYALALVLGAQERTDAAAQQKKKGASGVFSSQSTTSGRHPIPTWSYVLAISSTTWNLATLIVILEVLVPLAGRVGLNSEFDVVASVVVSFYAFLIMVPFVPILFRFNLTQHSNSVKLIALLGALAVLVFSSAAVAPYDAAHPKRVNVYYRENSTSGERYVSVGFWDKPLRTEILSTVERELGVSYIPRTKAESMLHKAAVYPFSAYMESHDFDVSTIFEAPTHAFRAPFITFDHVSYDAATDLKTISIRVDIEHHLWTVLIFEAPLVSWSLDAPVRPVDDRPALGVNTGVQRGAYQRYGLRATTGYGVKSWNVTLVVAGNTTVWFEASGTERDFYDNLDHKAGMVQKVGKGAGHVWKEGYEGATLLKRIQKALPEWATMMTLVVDTATASA